MNRDQWRAWREATEPSPQARARLRLRLLALGVLSGPPSPVPALLPLPGEGAVERVKRRIRGVGDTEAVAAPRRLPRVALALALLAALVLLWALPRTRSLDAVLESETWEDLRPSDEVALRYEGAGRLAGTDRDPVVEWDRGTLQVQVEPGQGVGLVVRTREARVRVVGTAFTVARDARGSTVAVDRGTVQVRCGAPPSSEGGDMQDQDPAEERSLGAGESWTCPPVSPAGWLARCRALQGEGADPALVLDLADRALARTPDGHPARGEIQVVRIESLVALGRLPEAREEARIYLSGPQPTRAEDVRRALIPAEGR